MVLREFVQRHLTVPGDHGEQVVEVVSDAARQPADALQFLCLAKLFFKLFPFGNVDCDPDEAYGFTFRVKENSATRSQPALDPVCDPYSTIVRCEFAPAFPVKRYANQTIDALPVIGMQTAKKRLVRDLCIGRQPVVKFFTFGPDELSGLGVEIEHPQLSHVDGQCQPLISIVQPRFRQPALAAGLCFPSLAFYGGSQSRHLVFQDVIMRAGPHHIDRAILADRAGHNDKRNIPAAFVKDLQRCGGVELGKLVVGDDNIPILTGEGLPHLFGVLDAFGADDVPGLLENAKDQRGVRF